MVTSSALIFDDLLTVAARHGLVPAEVKLADGTHLLLAPKDAPLPPEDPKAPKELPENFDELPVDNWLDPRDRPDTPENRKRADAAQEAADRMTLGDDIPTEEATGGYKNPPTQ